MSRIRVGCSVGLGSATEVEYESGTGTGTGFEAGRIYLHWGPGLQSPCLLGPLTNTNLGSGM